MLNAFSASVAASRMPLNLSSGLLGGRTHIWTIIKSNRTFLPVHNLNSHLLRQAQGHSVQISKLSTVTTTDQKFQIQWSEKSKLSDVGLEKLLDTLWKEHVTSNPDVLKVFKAVYDQGEGLTFDHFAYRTLVTKAAPQMGVETLARLFSNHGYQTGGHYDFPAEKLNALHLEPAGQGYPLVFISEFRVDSLSEKSQTILNRVAISCEAQIEKIAVQPDAEPSDFLTSGRSWPIYKAEYDTLKLESDYAAWFYLFGHRVNHFALNFDHSKKFQDLASVNQFIKDLDIPLNTKGGEIKDAPSMLAQSSTAASKTMIIFDSLKGGECEYKAYPLTFVEFVTRENDYSGFVAANAAPIFKSTN